MTTAPPSDQPVTEQRQEPRIALAHDVRININPSLLAVDLGTDTTTAQILDFSRGGLHLVLDSAIEEGDAVDIWVTLRDQPGDVLLHGHACWVKQDRRKRTHAGIMLEPVPGTAIAHWRAMFDDSGKPLADA